MSTKYDALVIGSGFGGSVTAHHLTAKGLNVALIERGPWLETLPNRTAGQVNTTPLPSGFGLLTKALRSIRLPLIKKTIVTNRKGLYEVFLGKGYSVGCSSCVGGGSNVYTALHGKPIDPDYWESVSEHTRNKALDPHYDAFLEKMGSRLPEEKDQVPNLTIDDYNNDPFLGVDENTAQLSMGVLFPEEPGQAKKISENGFSRRELDYDDDNGIFGSFNGSKTTLDIAYLHESIAAGLTLFDLTEAIAIYQLEPQPDNARNTARYRVDCIDHATGKRSSVFADSVFLGAGTLNTLKLLAFSSNYYHGLNYIPNLGEGIAGNGDSFAYWARNDTDKDYMSGTPSHGTLTLKQKKKSPLFITVGMAFANKIPMPEFIRKKLKRSVLLVGFGCDESNGRFYYHRGNVGFRYWPSENPVLGEIKKSFKEIRHHYKKPVIRFPLNLTVHPMGGARISDDPAFGVINGLGEMHSHPGLYVVDAAAFPKALGTPPSMSIAAWAGHVATNFVKRRQPDSKG